MSDTGITVSEVEKIIEDMIQQNTDGKLLMHSKDSLLKELQSRIKQAKSASKEV